jgi:hypothetical protein
MCNTLAGGPSGRGGRGGQRDKAPASRVRREALGVKPADIHAYGIGNQGRAGHYDRHWDPRICCATLSRLHLETSLLPYETKRKLIALLLAIDVAIVDSQTGGTNAEPQRRPRDRDRGEAKGGGEVQQKARGRSSYDVEDRAGGRQGTDDDADGAGAGDGAQ